MVTASFLIKNLLIHWKFGEQWFWDCLLDADLASNSASWQWVAGTGSDAAPFFRIFNPMIQAQKFDNEGIYIRKYVPEIAKLPNKFIFSPWLADKQTLKDSNVELGNNYPFPIIDYTVSRNRALEEFKKI
jgi:deoxyribodipyrimidine photo-lyase